MSADAVEDSLITQFARNLQRTQVAQELVDIGVNLPRGLKAGGAPRVPDTAFDDHLIELKHRPKHLKVGIIGAGMAGLYTAYILDTLNIPRISYEILEAAGRPGGRCLTHRFSEDLWDYYDVGAMRFPHNHTMDRYRHNPDSIVARIFQADLIRIYRFFKFAEDLGVELIPYYLQGENTPTRYNGKLFSGPVDWKSDPFGIQKTTKDLQHKNPTFEVKTGDGTKIYKIKDEDPSTVLGAISQKYLSDLKNEKEGWQDLLKQDKYSTREWLMAGTNIKDMSLPWVEYLETFGGTTDIFNTSFCEIVMQNADFGTQRWSAVKGGTASITQKAVEKIKTKPTYNKRVVSISEKHEPNDPKHKKTKMQVGIVDGSIADQNKLPANDTREYDMVINTTTLGALRQVDLDQAELDWSQRTALRALGGGSATKVAIKFKEAWWITKCGINKAGVGKTDGPLQWCVYPSYYIRPGQGDNLDDDVIYDETESAVLLCSYTWTQEALRMGALVHPDSPVGEDILKDLMLRELVKLHPVMSYDTLKDLYIDHHAYDWYGDPNTCGATALFYPGQYTGLYTHLLRPAGHGRLIFAGEAMSIHHGWILGALESAYRAVYQLLTKYNMNDEKMALLNKFGTIPDLEFHGVAGGEGYTDSVPAMQVKLGSLSNSDKPSPDALRDPLGFLHDGTRKAVY